MLGLACEKANTYVELAGNTAVLIFFFFNSSVVIPGFIVSVQPQGKYKDSFPNKSAQLIDKECGVTGGVDVLVREYLQLAW